MKAELEKQREELIKIEDEKFDDWHLGHENFCPVKVNISNTVLHCNPTIFVVVHNETEEC